MSAHRPGCMSIRLVGCNFPTFHCSSREAAFSVFEILRYSIKCISANSYFFISASMNVCLFLVKAGKAKHLLCSEGFKDLVVDLHKLLYGGCGEQIGI